MAAKPEAKINARMRCACDALLHYGVQAHRIEVRTGLGWPDWIVFVRGYQTVLVECKWVYSWDRPLGDWKPHQRSFSKRKLGIGIPVLLLVGDSEKTFLLDSADHLERDTMHSFMNGWGTTIKPFELYTSITRVKQNT